jgi:uncharacterized membrane protein
MRAVYPKFTVGRTSGPGPDGKRGFVLLVVVSVLAVGAVVGIAAYAGVRRWPETAVAAPHVRTETVVTRVHHRPGLARYLRYRVDPAAATGLALTVAVALVVVGVAAVGVLLAMVRTNTGLARYDDWLARFGAEHATSASTTFLKDVSLLGGTAGIVLASLLVAVVEWRRVRSSALLGFLLLTVAGQFALSNAVKELVERARPDIDRLTGFAGTSFPSGHATAAAACYMACALLLGRQRPVGSGGHRRLRGVDPGVAGRALVHRRARRRPARLGLVRALLDRLRGTAPALRCPGRGGRGGCRRRGDRPLAPLSGLGALRSG